jgi:hypothetical protein
VSHTCTHEKKTLVPPLTIKSSHFTFLIRGFSLFNAMGRVAKLLHLNTRGAVRVELERTTLLPGDEIVGVVHVRVTKPIPSARTCRVSRAACSSR